MPRLGRITCSTASVPMNTHSHQVLPLTRAEVSSEHTTGLAITVARIVAAAASSGSRARASMLLIAPSLMGEREDLVHQRGQPFHADGMGVVQIDHQGGDRLTERRAGFQPGRGAAVTRSPQQAQRPPNSRTRVTSGLIGGNSMRS